MKLKLAFATTALVALAPMPASAATVVGVDAMHDWNLIVLGDLNSSSEVEGRTFVGGNLSGNSSNYQIRTPAPASTNTPALTVVGNVTGGAKNIQGGGATVGGNVTSGFNLNGAPQTVNVGGTISNTNVNQNTINSGLAGAPGFLSGLTDQKNALSQSLGGLSSDLALLGTTGNVLIGNNTATFNVTPNADLAVFSLTSSDLDQFGQIQFNLNGANAVVVNVAGTSIVLNDNFLGNASGLGEHVIWNFSQATSLTLSTAFYGSILAPRANGTTSNFIEGSAVFGSLTQNGEVHLGTFNGGLTPPSAVPEPASWALMIAGFGLVGGLMRRNRCQAALALA